MKNVSQSLLSLGEAKLAIQAATSIGYDSQALGLMAVAVTLIAVDVALMGGLGRAWWLPLIGLGASLLSTLLLCLSFALGGIAQLLPSFWDTVKHLAN